MPAISPPIVLSGTIEPTSLSIPYRLGLAVVAVAMLLLPVLYLGLIAVAGVAVWWHLITNTWIVSSGSSLSFPIPVTFAVTLIRGFLLPVIYLAPAVAGLILLFFMVKPILARPVKRQDPLTISPDDEPALFAFINQVCQQVRAPLPRRVQMDCQANASASFMRGPLGIVKGDLVLTIGLPLAAGLSVREFGGALAHEFGHFAQGGAMRLTALIQFINGWFARVVYARDQSDVMLERLGTDGDVRMVVISAMARWAVWVSRRLLMGLMWSSHAISCFMTRQMEYDADSYGVKFAGSEAFCRTFTRMRELNLAAQIGYGDLRHAWQRGALPADFPAFVIERSGRLPQELLSHLRASDATTGLFDTHPSNADRMRVAEAAAAAGVLLGGDYSAALLFRNFEALSAEATRHHYTHDLKFDLDAVALVGLGEAIEGSRRRQEGNEAAAEFFGECLSLMYRPLRLPLQDAMRLDDGALREALVQARNEMAALALDVAPRFRRFEELVIRQNKAFAAEELLTAGLIIANPEHFELADATFSAAASTGTWALEQQQLEIPSLERFEAAAAQRLACGIVLMAQRSPSVDIQSLCELFNAVGGVMSHVRDANRFDVAAAVLSQAGAGQQLPESVAMRIQILGSKIDQCFDRVQRGLGDLPCHEQFTNTPMTTVAWCGLLPPGSVSAQEVIERILALYAGLLGQVVMVARAAEAASG
jgi:Zn-dependent protease with chaperone function